MRSNLSPRVRAAVLAAMLDAGGNRGIVERLLDNPEGYSALTNGLMQSAANLAELAQKPQYDISSELSQAVELYIEMHDKGQTVAEFEAQPDMFREQPSAEVMFLCRLFEAVPNDHILFGSDSGIFFACSALDGNIVRQGGTG